MTSSGIRSMGYALRVTRSSSAAEALLLTTDVAADANQRHTLTHTGATAAAAESLSLASSLCSCVSRFSP